jgi:hypothetical protein
MKIYYLVFMRCHHIVEVLNCHESKPQLPSQRATNGMQEGSVLLFILLLLLYFFSSYYSSASSSPPPPPPPPLSSSSSCTGTTVHFLLLVPIMQISPLTANTQYLQIFS